jgi:hypothetical protein
MPLFDALIAGLGESRQGLSFQCQGALRAVGGRALPYLRAAAQEASESCRKRIEAVAATIHESQDQRPDVGLLCREALLLAATVQTAGNNAPLVAALKQLGPAVADKLVRVAIVNRDKPAACLKALQMIEHLGGVSPGEAQLEVAVLYTSKNEAVRELALRLFCRYRRDA